LTRASDSSRLERRSERTLKLASMSMADLLHGASRGRYPSGFQMHCRLAIAGAWLMLFCTSATARVVLLTCRDGGSDVVQAFGRRVKGLGLCDLDKACDGICTFNAPYVHGLRCALVGGPDCSAGPCVTPRRAATTMLGRHCPDPIPRYAISLTAGRHRRTFNKGRVVVRCLPAKHCTTTTSTLPPGIPDLTGEWTVTETDSTDTCTVPPDPDFVALYPHYQLILTQVGIDLLACGFAGETTVSGEGFTVDSGDCCSIRNYNFAHQLTATLPGSNGIARVTDEWEFSPAGPRGGPIVCTQTAHAVMFRVAHPCQQDADCFESDGCTRCVAGNCVLAVGCR